MILKKLLYNTKWNPLKKRNFMNIRERKVVVNNVNINFVECGKGHKNVLLMPGALGTAWTDFRPQIERLPNLLNNYTIIAWDPPGYGKSVPPRRVFDLDLFYKDAEYAQSLMINLHKPKFSILGWSDGGITGVILASKFPSCVEKLVIWGANAFISPNKIKRYDNIRDISNWSQKMREPLESIYGAELLSQMWNERLDLFIRILHERNGNLCREELQNVNCPVLLLHGKKDPMVSSEVVTCLLKELKNINFKEFSEGKHNIHLRFAEEFNEAVSKFLHKV